MFYNFVFRKSYHLWDNVEKDVRNGHATDDKIIRRMHIPCLITKATNSHTEYEIFNTFP
jgi:hypothetical protein